MTLEDTMYGTSITIHVKTKRYNSKGTLSGHMRHVIVVLNSAMQSDVVSAVTKAIF